MIEGDRSNSHGARLAAVPHARVPACTASFFFPFFLFFFLVHFLYVRIRSIRSTRRAYNADRKLWRRAKLPPLSLSFSFRMCSMLPFQPSGGIVSSILETLWQNHEQFCQNKSEKEGYNTRFLFTYMLSHSNLLKLIEMTD